MASKEILGARYAKALWQTAKDEAEVKTWLPPLAACVELLESSPQLKQSLTSPQFSLQEKKAVLKDLCHSLKTDNTLSCFLNIVLEAGRIEALPAMLTILEENLLKASNTARAHVASALALNAAQQKQLCDALEQQTKKKIELELSIDPSLVAGIKVSLLGKTIDSSLSACLSGLSKKLKNNIEGNV